MDFKPFILNFIIDSLSAWAFRLPRFMASWLTQKIPGLRSSWFLASWLTQGWPTNYWLPGVLASWLIGLFAYPEKPWLPGSMVTQHLFVCLFVWLFVCFCVLFKIISETHRKNSWEFCKDLTWFGWNIGNLKNCLFVCLSICCVLFDLSVNNYKKISWKFHNDWSCFGWVIVDIICLFLWLFICLLVS